MHFNDDGDIVKAIGFVAIYSALLEDAIEILYDQVNTISPFKKNTSRIRERIGSLLKKIESHMKSLPDAECKKINQIASELYNLLKEASLRVDERNSIIHSRISADNKGNVITENKNGITPIQSKEIYELAESLLFLQGSFRSKQWDSIPRLLKSFQNQSQIGAVKP